MRRLLVLLLLLFLGLTLRHAHQNQASRVGDTPANDSYPAYSAEAPAPKTTPAEGNTSAPKKGIATPLPDPEILDLAIPVAEYYPPRATKRAYSAAPKEANAAVKTPEKAAPAPVIVEPETVVMPVIERDSEIRKAIFSEASAGEIAPPATPQEVLIITDNHYMSAMTAAKPGPMSLTVKNAGDFSQTFTLDGKPLGKVIPNETRRFVVDLDSGRYSLVATHGSLPSQSATLAVE